MHYEIFPSQAQYIDCKVDVVVQIPARLESYVTLVLCFVLFPYSSYMVSAPEPRLIGKLCLRMYLFMHVKIVLI